MSTPMRPYSEYALPHAPLHSPEQSAELNEVERRFEMGKQHLPWWFDVSTLTSAQRDSQGYPAVLELLKFLDESESVIVTTYMQMLEILEEGNVYTAWREMLCAALELMAEGQPELEQKFAQLLGTLEDTDLETLSHSLSSYIGIRHSVKIFLEYRQEVKKEKCSETLGDVLEKQEGEERIFTQLGMEVDEEAHERMQCDIRRAIEVIKGRIFELRKEAGLVGEEE